MPKVATKLTDTEIKKAKPTEKEFTLWDGDGQISIGDYQSHPMKS